MSGPVEFIERKLAMVEKVAKEEAWKVDKYRGTQSPDDEPIYCIDDDYHHPLVGDELLVIDLAAATRKILDVHKANSFGDCFTCGWSDGYEQVGNDPFPCATVKALATGWGWRDTP